jgi:hypothetical protein
MTQTPGNTISGAGAYGPGVLRPPVSHMWMFETVALLGAGALSLTVAGRLARPVLALQIPTRLVAAATRPINWALYNTYREADDFVHWARGDDMELGLGVRARPWMLPAGYPIAVPFPWLDIQPSHSSGGGGPGGLPNLHRPPPSIEETGEILSNPPMAGGKTGSPKPGARGPKGTLIKCPVGYYWDKRTGRCLKSRRKG